jgi:peroxiredoxin-like protein
MFIVEGTVMASTHTFRTQAHWTMHHRGIVEAESVPRTINFSAPPEFGGEPGLWTPEHLLLAAVSTCFVATLRAVSEASHLAFSDLAISTEGIVEKMQGGYRFTKIWLRPVVTVAHDEDRERMGRMLEKAERVCLISRSLDCTMMLEPTIVIEVHAAV